jgi:hypothetical protein
VTRTVTRPAELRRFVPAATMATPPCASGHGGGLSVYLAPSTVVRLPDGEESQSYPSARVGCPAALAPRPPLVALEHRLAADRQRIVELFPTKHRRVSVTPIRQRIVEFDGGSGTPSCVQVTAGLLWLCRKRDRREAGGGTVISGISAGNARRAPLDGSSRMPVACPPGLGQWPSNRHFSMR